MATLPTIQQDQPLFTIEAYLTLERAAEERHEYLDGAVYAMAGESPNHGRICTNLVGSLSVHLRGTRCEAFSKDMKVRCGPTPRPGGSQEGLYAYPDVVVVCGALQFHDQAQDVLLNPTVLVEVLSPSTEAFDRGQKFLRYRTWLPTLTDYVLVAQDRPLVEHYQRQEAGTWRLHTREGLEEPLTIPSLDWTIALRDVYDRVVFAPALHD
jgi:Uma2 family endonuclease